MLNFVGTAIKNPSVLKPYKRILLLSHMRATTSLFGHIMGSHPSIDGYYELHIGYYSWKSLWRQKVDYFTEHKPKKGSEFLFDKVLHNYHKVNAEVFGGQDAVIFMLRAPEKTIPSIVKLYQNIDPNHKHANLEGATAYYKERLKGLHELATAFSGRFLFLQSEQLLASPDKTLTWLTRQLGLNLPLTKEYQSFKKTGAKAAGDSSDNIKAGVIKPSNATAPNDFVVSAELQQQYEDMVQYLKSQCKQFLELT